MEILRNAGNRPNYDNDEGIQEIFIYENRLQSLLDTVLARRVNEIICHVANNDDEQGSTSPQPSFDRQYAAWVAAGLVVMMILLFLAPLFFLFIVSICTLNWIEWRYKHCRSTKCKSSWWQIKCNCRVSHICYIPIRCTYLARVPKLKGIIWLWIIIKFLASVFMYSTRYLIVIEWKASLREVGVPPSPSSLSIIH